MKIAGLQKNSFVDYPGNIAAVVFTLGCNLDCYYCHNRHLISHEGVQQLYDTDTVLEFLASRTSFLDGVVISGGEPTLQPNLEEFIRKVKRLGYPVKLDTNGTRPRLLKKLIENKLVDYVAMDIKAPLHRYAEICGVDIPTCDIEESINILMSAGCDYEFRTTFVPELEKEDIVEIAKMIRGARRYVLQQFRLPPQESLSAHHKGSIKDIRLFRTPHPPSTFTETVSDIEYLVETCLTRGI